MNNFLCGLDTSADLKDLMANYAALEKDGDDRIVETKYINGEIKCANSVDFFDPISQQFLRSYNIIATGSFEDCDGALNILKRNALEKTFESRICSGSCKSVIYLKKLNFNVNTYQKSVR